MVEKCLADKVIKLAKRSPNIQSTPSEAFEEALEICAKYQDVVETIAYIKHSDNKISWFQGGSQSNDRLLWNLTGFMRMLQERWFG